MKLIFTAFLFIALSAELVSAEVITYCRPNNMVSALAYIAEERKFFEEEGVELKFETITNAKLCLDLLVTGKAQIMSNRGGPLIYAASFNPDLKIIAKTLSNTEMAVFGRKDRGINNKLEGLKNKRIGYLPGTNSFLGIIKIFEKLNLTKNDFRLVPMQPQTMTQALIGGSIDGFIMWEPWGTQALEALKENGSFISLADMFTDDGLVTVTSEFAGKADRTAITGIIKALINAEDFILKNKEQSIDILSKKINFSKSILEKLWESYAFDVKMDSGVVNFMKENFLLLKKYDENFADTKEPDFNRLFDSSFLKAVDARRVKF